MGAVTTTPLRCKKDTMPPKHFTSEQYIPISYWSKDHWSTLAYIDSVMTDQGGFQVGFDIRMRQNRRNYRVMSEQCPRPRRNSRPARIGAMASGAVMTPTDTTVLCCGATTESHDDWSCVQDMAQAGFFDGSPEQIEPCVVIHFSELGHAAMDRLRRHKQNGGSFTDFRPEAK